MKIEILTRYAESGSYYKLQEIDFDKLSNIMMFPREVFAYIANELGYFENHVPCISILPNGAVHTELQIEVVNVRHERLRYELAYRTGRVEAFSQQPRMTQTF